MEPGNNASISEIASKIMLQLELNQVPKLKGSEVGTALIAKTETEINTKEKTKKTRRKSEKRNFNMMNNFI